MKVVPSLLHSGRALPPSLRPCPHSVLHSLTDKVSPMCHVLVVCHHHQRGFFVVAIDVDVGDLDVVMDLDEVGDVDLDVVVGLVATLPMTRTHSLPAEILIIRFLLREMLGKSSERCGYGGPRGPYRGGGGHRGGFSNGEIGEAEEGQPQRAFDRCNGIGRGNEFKREGSGRDNWGTQIDELAQVTDKVANETEKNLGDEKPTIEEDIVDDFRSRKNHTLSAMLLKFSDYSQLRDKFCECYVCNILLVFNYIYYLIINYQVRTLDPKAVNDENCTGNTSDGGNNTWYILLATTTFCF
ncbi:RGG repeats nuclear RNA binding protein A [Glycine soja]